MKQKLRRRRIIPKYQSRNLSQRRIYQNVMRDQKSPKDQRDQTDLQRTPDLMINTGMINGLRHHSKYRSLRIITQNQNNLSQ